MTQKIITDDPMLAAAWERSNRQMAIAQEMIQADPSIPEISAIIMAGDRLSAEVATQMIADGEPFDRAIVMVGSYSRLDWALRMQEAGHVTLDRLLDDLPELWRGSDPDDTDPRFLRLWNEAWERNGRKTILDDPLVTFPRDKHGFVTLFRGQDEGVKPGIAWSTNEDIARKFSNGAALRVAHRPTPVVYTAKAHKTKVMAYLTRRGESEAIVNPFHLR